MSEKTIKDFIPDLPEHCGHWNRERSNFCSECGQKLPTQEETRDVYLRHWFYDFVYKELRNIFDNKTSVYDLIAKLVFENETGCDPRAETSVEVVLGEFVEGDDEGKYYPTVDMEFYGDTGEHDFRNNDYWHSTLPSKLGWGSLEPCDYLNLVKVEYDHREGFTVGYVMKPDQEALQRIDTNRPETFEAFSIAVMSAISIS
jgi:hypothetical protein